MEHSLETVEAVGERVSIPSLSGLWFESTKLPKTACLLGLNPFFVRSLV